MTDGDYSKEDEMDSAQVVVELDEVHAHTTHENVIASGSSSSVETANNAASFNGRPSRLSVFAKSDDRKASNNVPIALTWDHVKYTVVTKKRGKVVNEKVILQDVTGSAKPGEMIAIMGTSGAGKTSFLNVLAGRHVQGVVDGQILLNGEPRSKMFKRQSAYVEQDDLLFPNLTVRETFTYTALLRLPRKLTKEEKVQRAMDVITELGLLSCIDTRIGNEANRGISGGERKRTSIGVELITNPRMLFLDEPTSGLDSFTAFHIMESVRELANAGRAVITTLHQPNRKVFELFDKLLLLTKGRIVFYGPAAKAIDFFAQQGYPCPGLSNAADHFLDVVTVDTRTPELTEETTSRVKFMQDAYSNSEFAQMAMLEVAQRSQSTASQDTEKRKSVKRKSVFGSSSSSYQWNLPWVLEMAVLLSRAIKNFMREKRVTVVALVQSIFMSLLVGGIFFDIGFDQNSIQNRSGALFFILINQSFGSMIAILTLFQSEKAIFMRERSAGTYRVSAYYIAKNLSELPVQIFLPIVFGSIIYWMIGLNTEPGRFFTFLLLLVTTVLAAQSLGQVISAAAPSMQIANAVGPIVMILFLLFGGFYLNSADIWPGFYWIKYISFLNYGYRAIAANEYAGLVFECNTGIARCVRTGDEVLEQLDFADVNKWADFGVLVALVVGYRFLAYLALLYLAKPKSKI